MLGYGSRTLLFALALTLLVVGWFLEAVGVEVRVCSHSIEVPVAYTGSIDLSRTEYRYLSSTVVNRSGLVLQPNRVLSIPFTLRTTLGYVVVKIVGSASTEQYSGILSIVRRGSNGSREVVLTTSLGPSKSFEGQGLNTTLQFLKELEPGNYTLELTLDTSARLSLLELYGPSSQTLEQVAPQLELRAEDYKPITIKYPCGIDRTRAFIGMLISGAGAALLVALYASSQQPYRAQRVR